MRNVGVADIERYVKECKFFPVEIVPFLVDFGVNP